MIKYLLFFNMYSCDTQTKLVYIYKKGFVFYFVLHFFSRSKNQALVVVKIGLEYKIQIL